MGLCKNEVIILLQKKHTSVCPWHQSVNVTNVNYSEKRKHENLVCNRYF